MSDKIWSGHVDEIDDAPCEVFETIKKVLDDCSDAIEAGDQIADAMTPEQQKTWKQQKTLLSKVEEHMKKCGNKIHLKHLDS